MTTIIEHALSLEISRRFAASPARVFDAWLSEDWGQWLGPHDAHCAKASVEPRVGGRYAITMNLADGRTADVSGVYLEIVRPKKIVVTWVGCGGGESVLTLTFEPDGAGTLMKFRQDGFDSIESHDGHNEGWNGAGASFDKLEAFLARTAG